MFSSIPQVISLFCWFLFPLHCKSFFQFGAIPLVCFCCCFPCFYSHTQTISKKLLINVKKLFFLFSSNNFTVSSITLKSLIPFEFIFVYTCSYPVLPTPLIEKTVLFTSVSLASCWRSNCLKGKLLTYFMCHLAENLRINNLKLQLSLASQ